MAVYRITRTTQPGLAPAPGSLVPGQLAVEMATQPNPRLWVGVPTTIDSTGRRMIVTGGGGGGGGVTIPDAPTDGQIYGRNGEAESWVPVLPISGGILQGPLQLNNTTNIPLGAVPLVQVGTLLGFTVSNTPPQNPIIGQVWYNANTGQLEVWNGTAWVPTTGGYVPLSGATMSGNLILDGPPSQAGDPDQAATRGYVDAHVTGSLQFIGTMNAATGVVSYTASSGITATNVLVSPAIVKDSYVICAVSGTIPPSSPYLANVPVQVGDWIISDGVNWYVIFVSGEEVIAEQVAVSPPVLGQGNVQFALEHLLTNFAAYAPITSPGLLGSPTTPNPPVNDHSQLIANTAWVMAQIQLALQGPAGDLDAVLMIGDLMGSVSIAGSGQFFDQLTLSGDSSGNNPSTLPNNISSVELTQDAAGT